MARLLLRVVRACASVDGVEAGGTEPLKKTRVDEEKMDDFSSSSSSSGKINGGEISRGGPNPG